MLRPMAMTCPTLSPSMVRALRQWVADILMALAREIPILMEMPPSGPVDLNRLPMTRESFDGMKRVLKWSTLLHLGRVRVMR